jgi:thymidine kinase
MPGRIEVVCGCMHAGKTTELVRRMVKANNAIAFKPTLDARYHESKLATHDGLTQDAIPVPAWTAFFKSPRDTRLSGLTNVSFSRTLS